MADEKGFDAKSLSGYAAILLAGGAVGAGGVTITGVGSGPAPEMQVTIPHTITVELPPDQVELMNQVANSHLITEMTNQSINRLEKKFDEGQAEYKQDLRERRELDDALRTVLSSMTQELGIVRRNTEHNSGAVEDFEKRLRLIERTMTIPPLPGD